MINFSGQDIQEDDINAFCGDVLPWFLFKISEEILFSMRIQCEKIGILWKELHNKNSRLDVMAFKDFIIIFFVQSNLYVDSDEYKL